PYRPERQRNASEARPGRQQGLREFVELPIVGERQDAHYQIALVLPEHLLVGWEWRLDHGVVALHFEAMPPQRCAHNNVNAATKAVGDGDLTLHVLDLVDAGILAHEIRRGVVARGAILNFIGNDAQVGQAGIRYRERKAGIAEGGEVEFALADGGDLQGGRGKVHRFKNVRITIGAGGPRLRNKSEISEAGVVTQPARIFTGACAAAGSSGVAASTIARRMISRKIRMKLFLRH